MPRFPLPLIAVVTACSPSPKDTAIPSADPITSTPTPAPQATARSGQDAGVAAETVTPAVKPAPSTDASQAKGRRILSTAFVRIGPDGYLTVDLRDGHTVVLRDVTMRAADYCGTQGSTDRPAAKFCGAYDDVVAARPGGGPRTGDPASLDPLDQGLRATERSS